MQQHSIKIGNKFLAKQVKICKGISASRGLMFRRRLKDDECYLLVSKQEGIYTSAIHMFFVFFSIDVIWINKERKVVDVSKGLPPFWPHKAPISPAKYILELPAGKVQKVGAKIGDTVNW